jgi:5-deoxy-D-glucuronate isomerase
MREIAAVTPASAGWGFCGLSVFDLAPGESHGFRSGEQELIILPLVGGCAVTCDDETFQLEGRDSVLPEAFEADRLIAVEVLTHSGNWSSYPPHKHDEEIPGVETALEEIYYFEVARDGFGYQRAYRPGVDICREVRTGDTVLLPSGYHGPSMAAPGYDLYYLNVMAGPGERAWRFTDDPAHAWIRDTWAGQEVDPRLPMSSAGRHA